MALTSGFSVELPGIQPAYNAVGMRKELSSQHEQSWPFTSIHGRFVDPRQHIGFELRTSTTACLPR